MLEERILNLINADLDGELSQQERAELDAALESSAEARTVRAELLKLNNLLEGLPEQAPPKALAAQILDRVAPASAATFGFSRLFSNFRLPPAGLAFAAGLLATVAFYEVAPRGSSAGDTATMVGTMVANPDARPTRHSDSLNIDQPGLSGAVTLARSEDVFLMDFDLDSDQAVEIEVSFAEAGLSFGGLAHARASNSSNESLEISGGILRVENQGRQAFTLFLPVAADEAGAGKEITIGISAAGELLYTGSLGD